jgi:hypothetical protein
MLFKARCGERRLSRKMHDSKLEKELPAKHAKKREKGTGKGLVGELWSLQRPRSCKQLPSNRKMLTSSSESLRNFSCPFLASFRVFRGQVPPLFAGVFRGHAGSGQSLVAEASKCRRTVSVWAPLKSVKRAALLTPYARGSMTA